MRFHNFLRCFFVINFALVLGAGALASDAEPAAPPTVSIAKSSGAAFDFSPYYAMTDISATDKTTGANASLASSMNVGADLRYHQAWSETFSVIAHLRLGSLSFATPDSSSSSLQNANNFMYGIGLGGNWKLSSDLSVGLTADYQKEIYVRSSSTGSIDADAVFIPELGANFSLDLTKISSVTLGVSGEFIELFQASANGYTVSQGDAFGGAVYIRTDAGGSGSVIQAELGYLSRSQSSNIASQREQNIVLQVHFFFPFERKTEEIH